MLVLNFKIPLVINTKKISIESTFFNKKIYFILLINQLEKNFYIQLNRFICAFDYFEELKSVVLHLGRHLDLVQDFHLC